MSILNPYKAQPTIVQSTSYVYVTGRYFQFCDFIVGALVDIAQQCQRR